MEITAVSEPGLKSSICSGVLRKLPDWFGIEASIVEYTSEVCPMPFYAAFDGEKPIGFAAVKIHNASAAEVYVMGILNEYHGQGIGTALIQCVEQHCIEKGIIYLTVKTLDGSSASEPYEGTRKFYQKMGFTPLEVFPLFWDKENPCLFLVKHLEGIA